jgi:hypothetical protein
VRSKKCKTEKNYLEIAHKFYFLFLSVVRAFLSEDKVDRWITAEI